MRKLSDRLALLLVVYATGAEGHSWLDCLTYVCPGDTATSGPRSPEACTCTGYARNWNNVMAGAPFAADRGRDNRPGRSPAAGGLVCNSKEPNPGPGTGTPAGMYSDTFPMATLRQGQLVRTRWPAKNHANTPNAGTVEIYLSETANQGDVFSATTPIYAQMSYSSDNGDCLGIAQSTDTADCQGVWQVKADTPPGRYTASERRSARTQPEPQLQTPPSEQRSGGRAQSPRSRLGLAPPLAALTPRRPRRVP